MSRAFHGRRLPEEARESRFCAATLADPLPRAGCTGTVWVVDEPADQRDQSQATSYTGWLSERRRGGLAAIVGVLTALALRGLLGEGRIGTLDALVLALLAYTAAYLLVTSFAFSRAHEGRIHLWAKRESRGTVLQRYVWGTAPGPGASLFIAAVALVVAVVWMPGYGSSALPAGTRIAIAIPLIAITWFCVVVTFAVTFHADNLVEDGKGLDFPGDDKIGWSDYVYFAVSVMTTFGTTDVSVTSAEMRRTVTVNAAIAFVFNTVTVATAVSALT